MKFIRKFSPATIAALLILVSGCGYVIASDDPLSQLDSRANQYRPFTQPFPNNAELHNYEAAQRLYAQPSTIIYCTTTWGNASAPLVTIPIAGKLTSSSVSYYASSRAYPAASNREEQFTPERRSVDGLYHGSPPPYRYGFTPGGQYVDFFNMPTLCTTALTKFQRQTTKVSISVDDQSRTADQQAQAALRAGDKAKAQRILEALDNTGKG